MKLRDKLRTILPDILPQRPQDAIKGKELIARVRTVLGKEYSDGSLLSQFSALAFEEGTRLARVPGGQGYYLRREGEAPGSLKNFFTEPESADDSPLHRAIALAVRLYDTEGLSVFVFPVEISWLCTGLPDHGKQTVVTGCEKNRIKLHPFGRYVSARKETKNRTGETSFAPWHVDSGRMSQSCSSWEIMEKKTRRG